jgi:hypothetical protein
LRPGGTGTTLADDREDVDGRPRVRIEKQELVRVLRTEGDNDTAERVAASLPEQIDTDRDGDQLASVGLDPTQLMAKLAGGGYGGSLAP